MIPESNEKSTNTILFVKIIAHCSNQNKEDIVDDWRKVIRGAQDYLEVRHLCKSIDHNKGALYIVDNRQMFIFKKRVLYTLLYRQRGTKAKMKSTTLKTKNSPWLLTMYKTWACVICRSSLWKLVLNTLGEEFLKNTFLDIRIHFWIFTFTAFVRYIFSEQYLYFLEVRVVIWFVV